MPEEINYVTIVKTFTAFYNLVRIFLSILCKNVTNESSHRNTRSTIGALSVTLNIDIEYALGAM